MSAVFNIGDSVTFINEKQNGIVLGFKANNIVVVEIEDGFTLDVLSKEIVVVKSSQEKAMGVKPIDNKSTDKTTALSPTPDFSSHIENASVVLLAVPEQSAVLTGKIKFILVNALGGQIQGACFEKQKNKLKRIAIFSLSTNQQSELFEFTREQLMSFDSFVVSYVYSDNEMFSSGSKEITIEYPENCQTTTMMIDQSTTLGSPSHSFAADGENTVLSAAFIGPFGANRNCHKYAVATGATTAGAKNRTRRKFLDFILEWTPSAKSNPTRF